MKPFEEMEAAEAEQKKAEAEAVQKETQNQTAANDAVNKIWDFANGTLVSGATRELYNDALAKVNALTDETKKMNLCRQFKQLMPHYPRRNRPLLRRRHKVTKPVSRMTS